MENSEQSYVLFVWALEIVLEEKTFWFFSLFIQWYEHDFNLSCFLRLLSLL